MRNGHLIKMTMVALAGLSTAQVIADDLNIPIGQTQTLTAGTYEYDSVYIGGTLIADGDVNFIVMGQFVLDFGGLLFAQGSVGANGAYGDIYCLPFPLDYVCGYGPPTSGMAGADGSDVMIEADTLIVHGEMNLRGGNGGVGGVGDTQPHDYYGHDGGRGGNGGHGGTLTIQSTVLEIGPAFLINANGGTGGTGGEGGYGAISDGDDGNGGDGGNGGFVSIPPGVTYINSNAATLVASVSVAGGQGGICGGFVCGPWGGGYFGNNGSLGSFVFPEFCDGNVATGDSDGDGACNNLDLCPNFDDSIDGDSDTIPDGCDVCEGFDDFEDCNGNGLVDGCEDMTVITYEEGFGHASSGYSLNGSASLTSGAIRLTDAVPGQIGSVMLNPVSGFPVAAFEASFDFKMGGGTGADGMSFALFDADLYDNTVTFSEGGGPSLLSIGFDTYRGNAAGGNHVTLKYDGAVLADELVSVEMNDNQWHHAEILFDGSHLTLTLTLGSLPQPLIEVPFNAVQVPGFVPTAVRYGFGARTGSVTDEHRVDNIRFVDTSNTNDCNGNGVPDQCDADANGNGIPDDCEVGSLVGDMNCDGVISVSDIGPFVLALTNPAQYAIDFPNCDVLNGDVNDDGLVTVSDIGVFVALLTAG